MDNFCFFTEEKMKEKLLSLQENGVILQSLNNIYIDEEVVIEKGAVIYANNHISGKTIIKKNAVIFPYCNIVDSVIGENTTVTSSTLNSCSVGDNTTIGPNAYLRPNSIIGNHCRIGDFVEIKNSSIGQGTKVSHLAYVGDADVGEKCNVGCGVIFANYNGKIKSHTKVGNNVFIGSNSNLIAPIEIEDNVFIAAGTTITKSLKNDDFVIGRSKECIKNNRAHYFLNNKID